VCSLWLAALDPLSLMQGASRGRALRGVNFPRSAKVYDDADIPAHNLAAKKEVQAAKVPDLLGVKKPGWNTSTLSENMSGKHNFPDRAMMRQLAEYDSHKRADYNFRAEQLDAKATEVYVPRPSKFQTNARELDVPRLAQPHHISRCEFPVHEALEGKPRWDPATGAGGDPYGVEKANRKVLERERVEALEYSRRHPPKHRTETLVQREERYLNEQRAAKAAVREKAKQYELFAAGATMSGGTCAQPPSCSASAASWCAANTAMVSSAAPLPPSQQVPVRKQTTWSLGGF